MKYWLTAREVSLPRNCVVWLTDRPNMTIDVYRGHKATIHTKYLLLRRDGTIEIRNPQKQDTISPCFPLKFWFLMCSGVSNLMHSGVNNLMSANFLSFCPSRTILSILQIIRANSVDPGFVAHYESPLMDLHCW